jgi:hypothetical protein
LDCAFSAGKATAAAVKAALAKKRRRGVKRAENCGIKKRLMVERSLSDCIPNRIGNIPCGLLLAHGLN